MAAEEAEEVSYFFDQEYPIYRIGENTPSLMSNFTVDGYVTAGYYLSGSGSYVAFQGDTYCSLPSAEDGRQIYMQITLPEVIGRGTDFDLSVSFIHSSCALTVDAVRCWDENWSVSAVSDSATIPAQSSTVSRVNCQLTSEYSTTKYIRVYMTLSSINSYSNFTFYTSKITISEVSSSGLLKNIISMIADLPGNIADSLSGFFDMVVTAVNNLGDYLLDGIKSLFIPSADDLAAMKEDWETLLEDRFGGLYQAVALIDDYAVSFSSSSKNTIDIPSISVPVAGADFQFGGWTVPVVPDGFSVLIDAVKLIISILATCLFVNGLRNRFERTVDGEGG